MLIACSGPLIGSVTVSPSVQESIFLFASSLLAREKITLSNLPNVGLIKETTAILGQLGIQLSLDGNEIVIDPSTLSTSNLFVSQPSSLPIALSILPALLTRFSEAKLAVSQPTFLSSETVRSVFILFEELGYTCTLKDDCCQFCKAESKDTVLKLEKSSSFLTRLALLAAVGIEGVSVTIKNPRLDPETLRLVNFLQKAAVPISTDQGGNLVVEGVDQLSPFTGSIGSNLEEAAFFSFAALFTGGEIKIEGIFPNELGAFFSKLEDLDLPYEVAGDFFTIWSGGAELASYEGREIVLDSSLFSSAWDPFFCLLASRFSGTSTVRTKCLNDRPAWLKELVRMGYKITFQALRDGALYQIEGQSSLRPVSLDLAQSDSPLALLLASLLVPGKVKVLREESLDNVYESITAKLKSLGVVTAD